MLSDMDDSAIARLERVMEVGFSTLADLISETNARLDQTNARLDHTISRLDHTITRVDEVVTRVDAVITRLDKHEQVLVQLVGEVQSRNQRFDNFLTGAHRQAHEELRARVERLEAHLGLNAA